LVGWAGLEPTTSCIRSRHASYCATIRCRTRGPPRSRTGKPSPCRGVALPVELAAHGLPGQRDGQPGQGLVGALRPQGGLPRSSVFHCAVINRQALSSRRMVLRMDGRNRTRNDWFWRPALFLIELRPYSDANENRPLGRPLRAASGWYLDLYPEASPAIRARLTCKDAGRNACLSPRSHW
jgi:hypothetical protein